ncbi:MAG: hypothetical protein LBR40_03015 [Bacilli bacterium]|jgi:DNA polymerase-3 subunit delta'|nr:hypothetical protein [Bacilli bacterium]
MSSFFDRQQKFIKQVDNCVVNNALPQAIILENASNTILDDAIDYIILKLFSNGDIQSLTSKEKNDILKEELVDKLVFDLNENNMKKEEAINIQERFMFTTLASNNKQFYIIKSIDKASASVLNSLLKFLEEPYENVYAIFTTDNINKILPTIVSRCINFHLVNNNKDTIINLLKDEFNSNDIELVYLAYNDETKIKEVLSNGIYDEFKNNINKMIKALFDEDYYLVCYEVLSKLEKEDLIIFLTLMYALLTHYNFEYQYLDKIIKDKFYNEKNYGKLIDVILSARMQLQTPMNVKLVIDMFAIEMEDLIHENS